MIVIDKGFTLIEILVSMAVMAIVLATLFQLQSSTVDLSESVQFKESAQMLVRQQLAALPLLDFDSEELQSTSEDFQTRYTTSVEIVSADELADWEGILSGDRASRLKKILVEVSDQSRGRQFKVETWRYIND
ncbi:MAG: prepilin-type N-terminal cleavage/methylation domain-containing protein [Desulfobacterales bacterium]|nr:prepilin-type N-terminal cleavage/methylation domain-containing protein [Desulfobacterales bacterium]